MPSYRGSLKMFAMSAVVLIAILLTVSRTGGSAPQASEVDVTVTQGTNFAVAASPDGRTLVTDLLGSLWTLPAQGGSARRITDVLLEAKEPSFSPDGKQIVFQGFYDADGWDLWTVAPDGSGAKRITSGPFDDMEPQWSHDGTRIAFSSDRQRNYDIWILDIRNGSIKQLTTNPAQDYFPAWSPDDKRSRSFPPEPRPAQHPLRVQPDRLGPRRVFGLSMCKRGANASSLPPKGG